MTSGCSKRPSSKAAASEETRRTLRYVEPLSDARTLLAGFFSILLRLRGPSKTRQHTLYRFLHHRILILDQPGHRVRITDTLQRPHGGSPHRAIFVLERIHEGGDAPRVLQFPQS